jgi:hypothetical protein
MGFIFTLIRGFAVKSTIHLRHGICEHKTDHLIGTCEKTSAQMRPATSTYLTVGSCVLMLCDNRCSDFHELKICVRFTKFLSPPIFVEVGKYSILP